MSTSVHETPGRPSIAYGIPLHEERGIATLTMSAFLKEIVWRYGDREAVVHVDEGFNVRWTYTELLARASEVARALISIGIGKGGRVGVLMTNRAEWIAAMFGAWLAGAIAVPISTFSTQAELEYLLELTEVSVLLVEPAVAKKDFVAMLREIEPALDESEPGMLRSTKLPYLRFVVTTDAAARAGAIEEWEVFLARGA